MSSPQILLSLIATVLAALISVVLVRATRPILQRVALAKPNARSSHRVPTPQGAGVAVTAATLLAGGIVIGLAGSPDLTIPFTVFAACLFIAVVGLADDILSLPVVPRLLLQAAAVAAVVFSVPSDLRLAQSSPVWLERGLLLIAGLWFVNLVNFMDGLDLMTAAEVVPITVAIVLLGGFGYVPAAPALVAAALCGALLGFAPSNRPVARIFLGDVGSLPIGLLLGWCLLELALHQQFAAALLLPLYYLTDATVTLFRRMARREPFWAAHRSHFYQRATDNGFTVWRVVGEVFVLNLVLVVLAFASVALTSLTADITLLLVGALAVTLLLRRFSRLAPPAKLR
ncbi:glycosyl transferase [Bradyrhizobium elkanii]|uniref:glycosyl transferase n=1 Tax=Bradyrhizobium elkanii TaxID=29448 RepID=UPI0009B764F6|nr:glycosyl transferase [Bradyrhizobium elkanii]MCP1732555.1 UDP-N-acetylmuramyl pentapeptide phosphotransferase/UDP-N-acetylglucosamine-1-phosphate transferase [Bradyrhizobium elkanii]MCS3567893.1 UDP-N-acetylmuramyl pentapeptide phosphotransferase/UDP-N-acetylglucosamine-1-phosphate transferase [Bradyrhizobium elkanii]MCS3590624.1 UDP-N-acetylmuramyl pentapeptide phosphotransferase/UDP-N-acetylglucosamine-1-phosphate transferase [Bradyrhizobium elkanii]MCS3620067.1 UDP-N-acetylmuramyl pentape